MIAALLGAALAVAASPPPRVVCGCPTARILERGPAQLAGDHTVTAWLHDDAQLELFQQDAVKKQTLTPVDDAPVSFDVFGDQGASPSRFVKVSATGAMPERAYLGILRKSDKLPRDAVAVTSEPPAPRAPGPSGAPARESSTKGPASPSAGPPVLTALWLAPLEARERPGCGTWLTHRIAFETAPGSPEPEAFLVEDAHTGRSAVVDARYAGVFGLGRVEVCDQGLAFAPNKPTHITVKPVSASFGVGEPWKVDSDGTGATDLTRTGIPASADRSRIEDPFPVPGMDDHKGPPLKTVAVAIMGTAVGGAALVALFAWVIVPMRRRRITDVRCPSCGKNVPYDALDPETDGFFCPSCGAAGFWKGKGAAAEATVVTPSDPAAPGDGAKAGHDPP